MPKTWFITGASRGLGAEIAKAAMRAGDRVVAAGRKRSAIAEKLGPDSDSLLSVELDVTNAMQAKGAVGAAVRRFGGMDVLVNNAGYGHMGFFTEYAKQIRVELFLRIFDRHLLEESHVAVTSVVHEHIHATKATNGGTYCALRLHGIGHIQLNG